MTGILAFLSRWFKPAKQKPHKEEEKMANKLKEVLELRKELLEKVKTLSPEEANGYLEELAGFVPRLFQVINQVTPVPGAAFADFYSTIFGDGAVPKKTKELIFTAIGVAVRSPRCLIHVIPAIKAGATHEEIFESVAVGFVAAGFIPNGPGIPYAFEYALKVLEVEDKYRKGEKWEYLEPAEFRT
jgi:alkylhydroperoxidase/carboxymuconolactone decarboxylase family protein YurZ